MAVDLVRCYFERELHEESDDCEYIYERVEQMHTCESCGNPLFDNTDPGDVKKALDRTLNGETPDAWDDDYTDRFWSLLREGVEVSIPGLGKVTAVHTHVPTPTDSYYNEFHQGYEGEAVLVIKIGDLYYKNDAPQNSYGRVAWHQGSVSRTEPKTKTIQVWA